MKASMKTGNDATTEVRLPWHVWLLAWLCTGLAGGFFGAVFMVLQGGLGGFKLVGVGFLMGSYLAALVGAILIPIFGLLARLLRTAQGASRFE